MKIDGRPYRTIWPTPDDRAAWKFVAVCAVVVPMVNWPAPGGDAEVAVSVRFCVEPSGRLKLNVTVSPGLGGATFKVQDYPLENWHDVMRVNVDGVFHCCRAVVPGIPVLYERDGGSSRGILQAAQREARPLFRHHARHLVHAPQGRAEDRP